MQTFGRYTGNLITITVEQMRKVDYLMENKYGINLYQMMENAGRSLALLSKKYFHDGIAKDKKVAVLAGKGGNGGGAIVAGRRLQNWGADVQVFLVNEESELKPITKAQLDIVRKMGIPVQDSLELTDKDRFDIILDGIYGYGLQGPPEKKAAYMIDWTQEQQSIVLSLDTPSGIELSTGKIHASTIKADATLTLALPKDVLLCKDCIKYTGELFLADISIPAALYVDMNLPVPDYFSSGDIVQIHGRN